MILYSLGNNCLALFLEKYEVIEFFERKLSLCPSDYISWYKACYSVKIGKIEIALNDLSQAIKIGGQKFRDKAKNELDFESVRIDSRFIHLLEP